PAHSGLLDHSPSSFTYLLSMCFTLYTVYFCFVSSFFPLQVLHSFPTRRSSDLKSGIASFQQRCHSHPCRHRVIFCPRLADGKGVDRKSTRLNSSHGSISYAVFCLKKKKQTNKSS